MSEKSQTLEAMSCEELLRELARLSSEHDHTQAQVGAPDQAPSEQAPQIEAMIKQNDRIARIGELLKAKQCQ